MRIHTSLEQFAFRCIPGDQVPFDAVVKESATLILERSTPRGELL
jgi:hypothetical protein